MNNSLSELTAIVVTYKTDIKFLKNCLNSIDSRVKVIIVENSKNFIDKNEIEIDYAPFWRGQKDGRDGARRP